MKYLSYITWLLMFQLQIPNHLFRLVSGSVMQKQIYLFEEISKTQGKSLTQELYAKKVFECREMRGLPVLCGN